MLQWAPSSHPSGASSPLSNSRSPWVLSHQSLRWCQGLSPSHGASRLSSLPLSSPGPPWPGSFRQPPSCPHKLLCLCQLPCSKVPSPPLQPSQPRVTPPGQVHRPTSPGRKWGKKCLRISRWPSLHPCPPANLTSPPSPAPQRPSPVTSTKSGWHRIQTTVMTLTSPSWIWRLWLLLHHRPTHVSALLWRHKPPESNWCLVSGVREITSVAFNRPLFVYMTTTNNNSLPLLGASYMHLLHVLYIYYFYTPNNANGKFC